MNCVQDSGILLDWSTAKNYAEAGRLAEIKTVSWKSVIKVLFERRMGRLKSLNPKFDDDF